MAATFEITAFENSAFEVVTSAGISHVANDNATSTDGSLSTAVISGITATGAGSLLVCGFTVAFVGGTVVSQISDNAGNIYTRTGTGFTGTIGQLEIWYAANATAGATTLTITCDGTAQISAFFAEFTGAATVSPTDTSGGQNALNSTAESTGNITPSGSGELLFAVYVDGSNTSALHTATNGNTLVSQIGGGITTIGACATWKIVPGITATAGTVTLSASNGNSAWGVFFKPAGAVLPTTDQLCPAWYTDALIDGGYRFSRSLQHEVFVGEAAHAFVPVVPPDALTGVQYNDSEYQIPQAPYIGRGSDQGQDWTEFLVIPAFDPSLSLVDSDIFIPTQSYRLPFNGILGEPGQDTTQFIILPSPAWDNDAENATFQPPSVGLPSDAGQDTTTFIILPAPAWDDDAEYQTAQAGYTGVGSDQGQDWTQTVIIPAFDPSLSLVDGDWIESQPRYSLAGTLTDAGQDTTNFILIPVMEWDNDADHQVQQLAYQGLASDQGQDWTQELIIPAFDPSFSFVDGDVFPDPQYYRYYGIGSDAGQDSINFIILPPLIWDNDADMQIPTPQYYGIATDQGQDWIELIIAAVVSTAFPQWLGEFLWVT